MRKWVLSVGIIGLVVVATLLLRSQRSHTAKQGDVPSSALIPVERLERTRVPFVGCKSDGQGGPVAAPRGTSKAVMLDATTAQNIAYYESEKGFGVLAPRGWHCFGTYGSDGDNLFVSPQAIDFASLNSDSSGGFRDSAIQLSRSSGDTSGRFAVARTIARVFPAHRKFVDQVIEEGIEPASSFSFGAYPNDVLAYKSSEVVEYKTPAQTDGLGTDSYLRKNESPITGVALLTGPDTDLIHLSVRLTAAQMRFSAPIVRQTERDFSAQKLSTATGNNTDQAAASSAPSSERTKGFPVPEDVFVRAYVLANRQDDLDENQLRELAHDEYTMAKQMDTQTVLLGGDLLSTRGKRAMDLLYNLSKQGRSTP